MGFGLLVVAAEGDVQDDASPHDRDDGAADEGGHPRVHDLEEAQDHHGDRRPHDEQDLPGSLLDEPGDREEDRARDDETDPHPVAHAQRPDPVASEQNDTRDDQDSALDRHLVPPGRETGDEDDRHERDQDHEDVEHREGDPRAHSDRCPVPEIFGLRVAVACRVAVAGRGRGVSVLGLCRGYGVVLRQAPLLRLRGRVVRHRVHGLGLAAPERGDSEEHPEKEKNERPERPPCKKRTRHERTLRGTQCAAKIESLEQLLAASFRTPAVFNHF